MSVPASYVDYLKSDALYAVAEVAGAAAKWGDKAILSSVMSPLVDEDDANDEATAQADFMAGPLARDVIVIGGHHADAYLRVVTITANRLGYEAGADVFVIEAREQPNGTTILKVLKRLAP